MSKKALIERRDRVFGTGAPLFYDDPLELVRGDGVYVFDADGRRYVDLYNNVPCVGHGNRRVAEAMAQQQATLNVHSRYLHEGAIEFAERLVALHGDSIESVVFSCSGTEANEVALHLARTVTGKRGIVCSNATYHGNSEAVYALTRASTEPEACPDIRAIPFPQKYRPIEQGLDEAALADAYLARLGTAIDSLDDAGMGCAGVIFCSIFANEGLPNIPGGYMSRAAEMVRAAGGLVIADEVQAGYGRTGRWWGYQETGFEPDVVVTGKPMGNGLPLAATAASKALVDKFRGATHYFNTCASSPLQAAVGMAVLDVLESDGLIAKSAAVGASLKDALTERMSTRDWIGDVRGHGLFIGVELVTDRATKKPDIARAVDVANRLKDKGFLTANAGAHGNIIKIRPPLVFATEQSNAFLEAFDNVLAEIDG